MKKKKKRKKHTENEIAQITQYLIRHRIGHRNVCACMYVCVCVYIYLDSCIHGILCICMYDCATNGGE